MGKFVSMSGLGYADLEETSDLGRAWAKASKKKAKAKPKIKTVRKSARATNIPLPFLMGDIKPFVSPIDDKEITSRSQLRAHERTHNVRQAGDFKRGELIARENKRVEETRRIAKGAFTKWE